jgi:hypothetical protein
MLNGVDPVILFNFKIIPPSIQDTISKIPLVADIVAAIDLPIVPHYLNEKLTGIYIDSEAKSVEVQTDSDTLSNGNEPDFNQRGIQSTVRINMKAHRDSIGAMLFAAMADLIFPKVTSKQYSITYLHGAVTVFGGLLHSFSMEVEANTTLYNITLELIKPSNAIAKTTIPVVGKVTGATPL